MNVITVWRISMYGNYCNEWFMDFDNEHKYTMHRIEKEILHSHTPFQDVKIFDTFSLGRLLVTDNRIQSAEIDEAIYHECLVHPSMMLCPKPVNVLILGGGEGATLREIVRYSSVQKIVMIDIDEELVNICKNHLQSWHCGAFNDTRLELIFDDAEHYITHSSDLFDVIIMDISDPVVGGPAARLYTREFYLKIKKHMQPRSVFATQAVEITLDESDLHSIINRTLREVFSQVNSYYEHIPSFSSYWGFIVASDFMSAGNLSIDYINQKMIEERLPLLKYYDAFAHQRIFLLPRIIREHIMQQTKISTVANPLSVFSG